MCQDIGADQVVILLPSLKPNFKWNFKDIRMYTASQQYLFIVMVDIGIELAYCWNKKYMDY